jgi:hypothetical protein
MPSSDNESWIKLLLVIISISILSSILSLIPLDIPGFTTSESRISSLIIITLMVIILSIVKKIKKDQENPVLLYSNLSIGFLLIIGSGLYLLKILLTEQPDNLRGYIPLNIGIIGIISCIVYYLFYKFGTDEKTKFRDAAKYLKYKYLMFVICFICVLAIIYGSLNQDKEEDKIVTSWDKDKGGILTTEGNRRAWLPIVTGIGLLGGSLYVLRSNLSTGNKKIKYSAIGFICISILFIVYNIWEYIEDNAWKKINKKSAGRLSSDEVAPTTLAWEIAVLVVGVVVVVVIISTIWWKMKGKLPSNSSVFLTGVAGCFITLCGTFIWYVAR